MRTASQCKGSDLGERMRHALNHALACGGPSGGPCDKAIVMGTDIPDVEAEHVDAAVRLLDYHDVVFGPAADGGYYLLGVKRGRHSSGKGSDGGGGSDGGKGGEAGDVDEAEGGGKEKQAGNQRHGQGRRRKGDGDDSAGFVATGAARVVAAAAYYEGGAHPALFAGIPWSTGTVLADSVVAARRAGLSVAPHQRSRPSHEGLALTLVGAEAGAGGADNYSLGLPVLQDIDTSDDLVAWVSGGSPGGAVKRPLRDAAIALLRAAGLTRAFAEHES